MTVTDMPSVTVDAGTRNGTKQPLFGGLAWRKAGSKGLPKS